MKLKGSFLKVATLAVATTFASLPDAQAATVAEGYELFAVPERLVLGTTGGLQSDPWIGDPDNIGEGLCARPRHYDFGDGNGCVNTGDASIILKHSFGTRNDANGYDEYDLTIMAMSLVSTAPVPGVPQGDVYSLRYLRGPGNTVIIGTQINNTTSNYMRVYDNTALDTEWALSANVVQTNLTAGTPGESKSFNHVMNALSWSRTPPANALEIGGINSFLNGTDRSEDIWRFPRQPIAFSGNLRPAVVPLPPMVPAFALVLMGGLALGARRRAVS